MAATPIPYPLLNGVAHSWASVEIKLNGQIFTGFKSFNYTYTRERTFIWGNHPDPLRKTRGKMTYKADGELYLAEWNLFLSQLGPGFSDVFFDITASYTENGFDTITDVVRGCTVDSMEASQAEGTDALVRKFELNPLKVLPNGIDPLSVPLAGVPT